MFLISRLPELDREVKADPYSLDHFIEWLRMQPAEQTYQWECVDGGCLISQYAIAQNGDRSVCHYSRALAKFDKATPLVAYYGEENGGMSPALVIAAETPRTFGAALERAEKCRAISVRDGAKP